MRFQTVRNTKHLLVLLLSTAFLCTGVAAQQAIPDPDDPLNGILSGLYGSNTEDQLNGIAREHGLSIRYDKAYMFGKFGDLPLKGLSVRAGLEMICAWTKTHFLQEGLRTVWILPGEAVADSSSVARPMDGGTIKASQPQAVLAPIRSGPATGSSTEQGPSTRPVQKEPTRFDITVSGIVRDGASGESLPFANVGVRGTTNGASTNVDGRFTLLHVPTDTSVLVVSYIGYERQEFQLSPTSLITGLTLELNASASQLREVEVVAEKVEAVKVTEKPGMMRLTPAKIEMLPNLGEKDIFRSFQLLPGVSAANENSSGLYVRGGTPDQALVLYDGFTVYNVDHLFGFFSAFNSNAIKDVQLYKGGFEAKYGGRLSSVVDITGKDGNSKEFKLNTSISLLSVNLATEIPISKKSTLLIAARKSWKSPIYNKIFDQYNEEQTINIPAAQQTESSVSSFFYDVNAKYTYRPTDRDVLSFSLYNGQDKMDNSLQPEAPSRPGGGAVPDFDLKIIDRTDWGNTGVSLKWSRQWNPRLYSNTLVSTSSYFSTRDRGAGGSIGGNAISNTTNEDNNLRDLSFRTDHEWKWSEHQQIEFGGQVTYNDIDYTYGQNDSMILTRAGSGTTSTLYLQDRIKLFHGRLTLLPGVRASYYDVTGMIYTEPRAQATFQLTEKFKLKGATGLYYQFAKRVIRESVTENSRDFWLLADGDKLPVSSAIHYTGGFTYELGRWVFDAEAYHKELSGLSEYSLRFNADPFRIDYSENFFQGHGYAKGIDLLLQRNGKKFTGWVGYTLGEVKHQYDVYGSDYFYASNDVTHEFKLVGMWKAGRWDLSGTWIFATGRPYTAPKGGYQLTLLDGSTADYLTVTTKNGLRLPDYHRMDVSATYNFHNLDKVKKGSVALSLFNLYGRENVWYKNYEIVDNSVIETDVNYFGFTPNITLNWIIR